MKLTKYLLSVIILFIFSTNAFAANETIEMLNKQDKERMVYSKKVVKINLGDTVFWKATHKGHIVEFIKVGVGTPILTVMCISLGDFSRVWKKFRLECLMASDTARFAARL